MFSEYLQNANSSYKSIVGTQMQGPDTDKPQFIHLGFHFPHTPVMPSKEYRDKFAGREYKIPVLNSGNIIKCHHRFKLGTGSFLFFH